LFAELGFDDFILPIVFIGIFGSIFEKNFIIKTFSTFIKIEIFVNF